MKTLSGKKGMGDIDRVVEFLSMDDDDHRQSQSGKDERIELMLVRVGSNDTGRCLVAARWDCCRCFRSATGRTGEFWFHVFAFILHDRSDPVIVVRKPCVNARKSGVSAVTSVRDDTYLLPVLTCPLKDRSSRITCEKKNSRSYSKRTPRARTYLGRRLK